MIKHLSVFAALVLLSGCLEADSFAPSSANLDKEDPTIPVCFYQEKEGPVCELTPTSVVREADVDCNEDWQYNGCSECGHGGKATCCLEPQDCIVVCREFCCVGATDNNCGAQKCC